MNNIGADENVFFPSRLTPNYGCPMISFPQKHESRGWHEFHTASHIGRYGSFRHFRRGLFALFRRNACVLGRSARSFFRRKLYDKLKQDMGIPFTQPPPTCCAVMESQGAGKYSLQTSSAASRLY